ncbi:MAG: MFS transporter [Promethearchaeota archaeon]
MSEIDLKDTRKRRIAFAFGEIGDNVAYQSFTFLVFTFYFTLVRLPVMLISVGFIIWSIWNAFNDPLIGHLSDKTRSSKGRRIPWMIGGTIPLAAIMFLLFMPPVGLGSITVNFFYFLSMIIIFDTAYTSFNLNYNAAFSEMFTSVKDRSEVGRLRIFFVIGSLVLAFVLPTLIIEDLTNKYGYAYTQNQFVINGIVAALIIISTYFVVLKWGVKNTKEFSLDAEKAMGFKDTIKYVFKNKSFLWFLFPALGTWIVIGILPTIIPLWATHVLEITEENSILTGVLLLVAFLTAGFSTPLWTKIRQIKDARMSGLIGIAYWAFSLLLFLVANNFISGLISMIVIGVGLGGSLYFYDKCIAEIIEEDERIAGIRRAGSLFGVLILMIRLSGVINYLIIGLVFSGSDWQTYTPNPGVNVLLGLKFLLAIYPAIVLGICFIGLYFYPIKGKHLEDIRKKFDTLHAEKQKKAGITKDVEENTNMV